MDVIHNSASVNIAEEEDRISNLPDDIIHRILSFLDLKYAVQTSSLSKKWEHIWTTMPHLNFDSRMFPTLPQFAKFVKHALSHRNYRTQVSTAELSFRGSPTQFVVKNILRYVYSHNVKQLSISMLRSGRKLQVFPQCVFSSHTLKHLTLVMDERRHSGCCSPKSAWDLPVLETLKLHNLQLGDYGDKSLDLFSKCVNLKDLTLDGCSINCLDIFNIYAPKLSNLTVNCNSIPKDFNVVAPQLQNLTAKFGAFETVDFLSSIEGFDSIEKVNLSFFISNSRRERCFPQLLDLFRKLRSAKFLILNMDIIQTVSSGMDQLLLERCPFNNLKWLKIDTTMLNREDSVSITKVINYLLWSSPNATFIMDLPQVAQKRSREEIEKETRNKKMAKLEKENNSQDMKMLEEKLQMVLKLS